ncbi:MAG: hypothetical protein ACE5FY_08105, partial [Nitrospiria bacterium]
MKPKATILSVALLSFFSVLPFFKTNALPSLGSATNSPSLPHVTQEHPTGERLLLDGSCLH